MQSWTEQNKKCRFKSGLKERKKYRVQSFEILTPLNIQYFSRYTNLICSIQLPNIKNGVLKMFWCSTSNVKIQKKNKSVLIELCDQF